LEYVSLFHRYAFDYMHIGVGDSRWNWPFSII